MAASSRAAQFSHMYKVLKKHYKPTTLNAERSVLEHMLFACLAENAYYPVAEEAYAAVVETYYDWNEVRVTTIRELSEVMPRLPDPPAAAARMRRVLQYVFENGYVFDLEYLRKQNLGPTVTDLKKIHGASPFVISYVVQSTLGGHAIPLDVAALQVLSILGFATEKEVKESVVAGLERAIPKNKGSEFGSLLHEIAASFMENPFASTLKKVMLEINPGAKDRLPKRGGKKKPKPEKETSKATKKEAKKAVVAEADEESAPKKGVKKTVTKKAPAKKAPEKKVAKRKIVPTKKKVASVKKTENKSATTKKVATKKAPAKKTSTKKTPAKKTVKKGTLPKKTTKKAAVKAAAKKKSSKGITKRKPR